MKKDYFAKALELRDKAKDAMVEAIEDFVRDNKRVVFVEDVNCEDTIGEFIHTLSANDNNEIEIINDYGIKLDVRLNELTLTKLDQMIAFIEVGFIEKKEE